MSLIHPISRDQQLIEIFLAKQGFLSSSNETAWTKLNYTEEKAARVESIVCNLGGMRKASEYLTLNPNIIRISNRTPWNASFDESVVSITMRAYNPITCYQLEWTEKGRDMILANTFFLFAAIDRLRNDLASKVTIDKAISKKRSSN